MRFMIRGRQEGKSTRLLHWLMSRPNRCIIVLNEPRKDDLRRLAAKQDELTFAQIEAVKQRCFTVADVLDRHTLRGVRWEVGIDDLDVVLPALLGYLPDDIGLVTATGERL